MFRPPTKYSEYLQDVRKSIDYILKRVNATTVTQIVAGTNVTISPASGTGVVTINASGGGGGGLPAGGTTGQILAKINNVDYNAEWIDNYALWTSTVKHEVKAGEAINKGQAVYVSSADGTNMIVSKASNALEATSSKTLGILAQSLAHNAKGFVITEGLLAGLDTSAAGAAGDPVWLGTDGNLLFGLANKPYAPANMVSIGVVTRKNSSNGEIFVRIQNGFELDELHNVDARNPNNNDGIFYNSTTQLWEHKPVSAVYATPTLAQVTTAGNTTTNSIGIGTTGPVDFNLVVEGIMQVRNAASSFTGLRIDSASIRRRDTGTFSLGTNDTTSFNIFAPTNNIGINTTTDAGYKLDVNGSARVKGTGTTDSTIALLVQNNTGRLLLQTDDGGFTRIGGPTARLYVGVESGGAAARLVVNGEGLFSNGGIGNAGGFYIDQGGTSSASRTIWYDGSGTPKNLITGNGDNYITSGNFGIGTTSPIYNLEVSSVGYTGFGIMSGANNTAEIGFQNRGYGLPRWTIRATGAPDGSSGTLTFQRLASSFDLTIASTGNVLIGTTTDAGYKLDVNGTARFITNAYINPTSNAQVPTYVVDYGGELRMVVGSNGVGGNSYFNGTGGRANLSYAAFFGSAAGYPVQIGTYSGVNMTLLDNGNVGIGTTNPTVKLQVNGVTRIQDPSSNSAIVFTYGTGGWIQVIDVGNTEAIRLRTGGASYINTGQNFLIGTTTDAGYKLDVVGADSRFNGVRVGVGAGGVGSNTVVGNGALNANTSGYENTAIGYQSSYSLTGGLSNTAVGYQSLYLSTVGEANTAIGWYALRANTSDYITAVGYQALKSNTFGQSNTAVGANALEANTGGQNNTSVGWFSLQSNTTGSQNTALGSAALNVNSTGISNTAVGYIALEIVSTGNQNTAIGVQAGKSITTASNNTIVGSSALRNSTGSDNTAIGYQAGYYGVANTTGTNNIFIGNLSTGVSATESNRTWIGNSSTTSTWVGGNLLVGTTTNAGYKLDVNGSARVQGSLTVDTFRTDNNATIGGSLYLNSSILVLNKSQTAYIPLLTRNTTGSEVVYDLSNIGSITATGNVGIGTTTPTDKLHIVDNTNGNKFGRISAGGTDASAAWVAQNDQVDNIVYRVFGSAATGSQMGQALARSASLIANLGGTGKFLIGSYSGTDLIFGTSDQARMRLVDATGNFLIGTMTDTGNKLTVSGNIDAQGYKVNNVLGYTGILNIPTNPPGQQNIDIQGGIVINIF